MEKKFQLLYIMISVLATIVLVQSYFIYDFKSALDTKTNDERIVSYDAFHSKHRPVVNDFFNSFSASSYDPFEEIKRIQEEMQKSFGQFNSVFASDPFFQDAFMHKGISPLSDIKDNGNEYVVEINIPGTLEKNIEINTKNNILHISAVADTTNETNEQNYIHKERYTHRFERSFSMPQDADLQQKESNYENGVLKIVVPKRN